MQPLLFGINISTSAAAGADPVQDALHAEALGFDFVSASDHPAGSHPTFETWTMLTWIAAATSRIAVASRVLSIPFRSPALVAKMAESLDRLSAGRLILGLGAGATDLELSAFGLPVPSAKEKIDGLDDALHVIRGLWTRSTHTYQGRVHNTGEAMMEPKPVHRIPIWLGTFGDRALAITGRQADGWIPSFGHASFDQLRVMRQNVLAAAEIAGRSPEEIACVLNVEIALGDHHDPQPGLVAGPAAKVTARLGDFLGLGFNAFNFVPVGTSVKAQAEELATEVIPSLRAMA